MHLDEDVVQAVYDDWTTAPVREPTRAALGMIRRITLEAEQFGAADIHAARDGGLSDEAIEDALQVCAMFNIIDRIADAVCFDVPPADAFHASAKKLRRFGYALPAPFRPFMRRG